MTVPIELQLPPAVEAERVVTAVLADLPSGGHKGVVVDSPPGIGKSTLVLHAAVELAATSELLIIIAQTKDQVDDLIDRLALKATELSIGRLSATDYNPSERVDGYEAVRLGAKVVEPGGPVVIIGTAAKWATLTDGFWPGAIVDEAYQMWSESLLRLAGRCGWSLVVGDPGELGLFSTVGARRWAGLTWDPGQSAVAVLMRHKPELPVHRLPVSWRLPMSTAPVAAFYPFTGFCAGTGPDDRALSHARRRGPLPAAALAALGRHTPMSPPLGVQGVPGRQFLQRPARGGAQLPYRVRRSPRTESRSGPHPATRWRPSARSAVRLERASSSKPPTGSKAVSSP